MADHIIVATLGMGISMTAIVVGATLAGVLLYVIESRMSRDEEH